MWTRRIHGELTKPRALAVTPAAVWEILHAAGIDRRRDAQAGQRPEVRLLNQRVDPIPVPAWDGGLLPGQLCDVSAGNTTRTRGLTVLAAIPGTRQEPAGTGEGTDRARRSAATRGGGA